MLCGPVLGEQVWSDPTRSDEEPDPPGLRMCILESLQRLGPISALAEDLDSVRRCVTASDGPWNAAPNEKVLETETAFLNKNRWAVARKTPLYCKFCFKLVGSTLYRAKDLSLPAHLILMAEETKEQSCAEFALFVTLKIIGVLVALYFFLAGLSLMGGSFGALGGKGAGELFTITDNPIAGLTVGFFGHSPGAVILYQHKYSGGFGGC